MLCSSRRRGITLVEVIVVIVVLGVLIALLLPSIESAREPARRAACINNMKQIGLALHNYHDANRTFPASNDVRLLETPSSSWRDVPLHTPAEPAPSVGPAEYGTNFSWFTKLLPYNEEANIYKWLDTVNLRAWDTSNPVDPATNMPADANRPSHPYVWRTPFSSFKCPSLPDGDFCQANPVAGVTRNPYDPSTPYGPAGRTSYVALGATHSDSLLGVETKGLAGGEKHPNGVIYPGTPTTIDDITDGLSNTFIVCETREMTLAAWYEGATAAVFGLVGSPAFVLEDQQRTPGAKFGMPGEGTKTTINHGNDASKPISYYLADGPAGVPWVHGPSSHHPGLVNHLLGDGSVRSVQQGINPRLYMWLITRAGGEPVQEFMDEY